MIKKTCKASAIVEMAYLMPVVLLCWMLVVFALFYYHDKSIVAGAAYEAAVVGTELWAEESTHRSAIIEEYFYKRVEGKLLFYENVEIQIEVGQKEVKVESAAVKYLMRLHVIESAAITEPEKKVREMMIIKETIGDVTK